MDLADPSVIQQHLIDPEICIRCNTCESVCPVQAITHDDRNYVVDAEKCNLCRACIAPCPTGSIDNWRAVVRAQVYTLAEQLGWDALPPPSTIADAPTAAASEAPPTTPSVRPELVEGLSAPPTINATLPPWSAAHAYTHLYGPRSAQTSIRAKVVGNVRVTAVGKEYDTHHLVLDFGSTPFPVLEGQSIGVLPPGLDGAGRPHHARQYSVASPRNGERPGYNNVSLTVKRVLEDPQGRPVRGLASNFLCDLQVGDGVDVIGPFGSSFLMPNHPRSSIVMVCTGTGSAPMRAMTEWRRRLRASGRFEGGRLLLFFGARTPEELPYFGPLQNLPRDFIDIHFAYSRTPGQPKRYVQDAMRERAADLAPLLADPDTYFYVCGLKAMEEGVLAALRDVAEGAGLDWAALGSTLQRQARLHLETY